MDNFTFLACGFILLGFLGAWIFVIRVPADQFQRQKRWLDQLPSIISTLGVLGTFLGITKGLLQFDAFDLDHSIPQLLDGLKTAFFTSLMGMSCSLILTRVVALKFEKDSSETEVDRAARVVSEAIHGLKGELPSMLEHQNRHQMGLWEDRLKELDRKWQDIVQLKDDVEEVKGIVQEYLENDMAYRKESGEQVAALLDLEGEIKALLTTKAANLLSIELAVQRIADLESKRDSLEMPGKLEEILKLNAEMKELVQRLIELFEVCQETGEQRFERKGEFYAQLIKLFELMNQRMMGFERCVSDVEQIKDDVEEIKGIGEEYREEIGKDRTSNKRTFAELREILEQTHALATSGAANMASIDLVLQRMDQENKLAISAGNKSYRP